METLEGSAFYYPNECISVRWKLITDKNDIRDMWANHFEELGKPSVSPCFDHEFSDRVATRVRNIFASCQNELPGTLSDPLQYQEVFNVCSKLKSGVSGVLIMSIFALGVPFYGNYFTICIRYFSIKVQSAKLSKQVWSYVLPLFKGKGAKANNKDNYRGITFFPTLCKIYEMIVLNRLEKFASQAGYFSEIQFGFQEGSGCTESSFTTLETNTPVICDLCIGQQMKLAVKLSALDSSHMLT